MEESGPFTAGTRVVTSRNTRIRMKGDHATSASFAVRASPLSAETDTRYSSGISESFFPLLITITVPRQMTEPMISGSCGPMNFAVKNSGMVKETAAASVIPNTPFRAFSPPPKIAIITKGDSTKRRNSIVATLPERGSASTPETALRVMVGTPTEPNAVGMEFTTRHATMVRTGSKPSATRIPAGMATAVPKPAMPSMK